MKILIMGFAKVKYMPYLNFYLDQINRERNEVHLLYWNRDLIQEDLSHLKGIQLHELRLYQEDEVAQVSKIRNFIRYRKFAQQILRDPFDFIICLHSFPGVLLADKLTGGYQGRFIIDYRDKTYEDIGFFKKIIHRLIRASRAAFVSSDAFRSLLPESEQHKIHTSHNLLLQDVQFREHIDFVPSSSGRIRLAFWGILRNEELNRELIGKVASDDRFELHYYGREQAVAHNLKDYTQSLGTARVYFHGEYTSQDRYTFAANSDIIHNLYSDGNMMLAMANKFYDGLIFRLPQLCMRGSYMAQQAEAAGIGLPCDPYDENFLDQVYDFYQGLDRDTFRKQCDLTLQKILEQYEAGCGVIRSATDSNL